MNLSVSVGPLRFENPVLLASGTWGFGETLEGHLDLSALGGLVTKGISLEPRPGNPPPRLAEVPCGLLNAIGLENPGLATFRREILPRLRRIGVPVLVNIFGESLEEFLAVARGLEGEGVVALEVNVSCPNVARGGVHFGQDPAMVSALVSALRQETSLPLVVKLSPVGPVLEVARAALSAGACALTVANTYPALAVDVRRRRPLLARGTGGLSGPAIRPLTMRLVHELYRTLRCPIIACGGIESGEDVVAYFLAGASAVQVGTATLRDPRAPARILGELKQVLAEMSVSEVATLTGSLKY